MSKIHIIFVLAVSVASGCAAPLSLSCAPMTPPAAGGDRAPLGPLAQCACRGNLDKERNYFQLRSQKGESNFWTGKYRSQVHWISIPEDRCVDGRPVQGQPIALTLVSLSNWLLGTPLAVLTVSDLHAHPSYKFSTSPEGDLQAAWRQSLPASSTDRLSWVPADVMDPEIGAAFEAEKRFWLTELLGQKPTGPQPSPAMPSP